MTKLNVYDISNKVVGDIELSDEVFSVDYNEALIHQVVVALQNNARQGTKSTLLRSEVRGKAAKPWRQKGTGHARHGSKKGAQWTGGGIIFAPKPRDFSQKVNKKMRDLALSSAISKKIAQDEVIVLKDLQLTEMKTKPMADMLKTFGITHRALIVTVENDNIVLKSASNIAKLDVTTAMQLNVLDIVANSKLIFTMDSIKKLEEAYV